MFGFKSKRLLRACAFAPICLAVVAASASAQTRPLFTTQQLGASGVTQYAMNVETGALTQQGPITTVDNYPSVPGIAPDGSRLYVSGFGDSTIHGFAIGSSGLTSLTSFVMPPGSGPNSTVFSPSGKSLWTANNDGHSVSGFSVDSDGSLIEVGGSPFALGGEAPALAVSPNQSLMYLPGYNSNQLAGFSTGPGAVLTAAAGFPLAHTGTPVDVEYNVAGNVLYVANSSDDNVSAHAIDTATGALTELGGSPFAVGDSPTALAASPDGKWLFVTNSGDSTVQSFSIGSNGALAPIGSPVSTQSSPNDVSVTPDSRFVYTADFWGGSISGYAVGSDGGLTELAGSPFGDDSGAVASLAIVPDQGPSADFTSTVKDNTVSFSAAGSSDPDGSVASYVWDFGDGTGTTTTSAQTTHTYASAGSFTATLRVVDNENCSNVQIGTGQTLACNGSSRAVASKAVSPIGPLTLKHATGKQLKSKKVKGALQKRVQIEFFLNRGASVSYQFQKSSSKGKCRKTKSKKPVKKAKYKRFGKKLSYFGTGGRDRRTFTGTFGGKKIVAGRYRVQLKGIAPDSDATPTITSASFCVS